MDNDFDKYIDRVEQMGRVFAAFCYDCDGNASDRCRIIHKEWHEITAGDLLASCPAIAKYGNERAVP